MSYDGARVIVTGGLGFIGSNLAVRLAGLGAEVTVIDSLLPGCGSNPKNLYPAGDDIRVIEADIADSRPFARELSRADVIFNLAGEISHIHSMQFPERDLQVNTVSQLRFLLACREFARGVRIVYASTRQVYGVPKYLPVDEQHPIQPVDFNGVHKFAATSYHLMMTRAGELDAVILRLTNVYGPRMALDVVCQGVLSTFIRRAVLGQQIEIFGDGLQLRDPMYVDDAVEAFLRAGLLRKPAARRINVGGPRPLTMAEIAVTASRLGGCPEPLYRPFPDDRRPIDIGSFYTDNSAMKGTLGFVPDVEFADGMARTLAFYRDYLPWYLEPDDHNPPCRMPEHTGAPRRLEYIQVGGAE